MLTEVKNNYKSILKYFDFDESVSSSEYKKQKLIEMARKKEDRPSRKTKLGKALSNYTVKVSLTYDTNFDKTIRKLRKNWFVSSTEKANQKKQILIQMMKNGKDKPKQTTKLRQAFDSYITKSYSCYDPIFVKAGMKLRRDWFTRSSNDNKKTLIKMARDGKDKPLQKTKLGLAFVRYTHKSGGSSYDENFTKIIKDLNPSWIIKSSFINKQQLIEMASSGKDKPGSKSKEGRLLSNYTTKTSVTYDASFDKTIRKLRTNWFGKCSPK
jgi:hypothetical protein